LVGEFTEPPGGPDPLVGAVRPECVEELGLGHPQGPLGALDFDPLRVEHFNHLPNGSFHRFPIDSHLFFELGRPRAEKIGEKNPKKKEECRKVKEAEIGEVFRFLGSLRFGGGFGVFSHPFRSGHRFVLPSTSITKDFR
jgi:hypothetical protein